MLTIGTILLHVVSTNYRQAPLLIGVDWAACIIKEYETKSAVSLRKISCVVSRGMALNITFHLFLLSV